MKERYHITGMTCSACSAHVEKAAGKLAGVETVSVNLLTETMDIVYDESVLTSEEIVKAVIAAGYGAHNDTVEQSVGKGRNTRIQDAVGEDGTQMKWRLGVSIAFLLPLMYVAMFHMYKQWFGLPIPGFVMNWFHGPENAANFAFTQLLLTLPILYMNRKFFIVGFKTLGHLSPNMDSLIALGATAAVGYGVFAMYRIGYGLGHGDLTLVESYSHDLYFESAGMILTLITVGKYLESRSKKKTGEAISKLMDLSPKTTIRIREDGTEEEILTEELRQGDIFLVKPGSLIPVDGTVLSGVSGVDEAAITGESVPVLKKQGDNVISATMNKNGALTCRADHVGEDTTLSKIIRLVEEASAGKAPIAQLADKVAGVFVPVVIGIAVITLCAWLLAGAGLEFAMSCAIAVLVISCPCALGLATPVAIMVGTGVGASHGILIKSGEALQETKEVDTVVLDKTGTVTKGKLHVAETVAFGNAYLTDEILAAAASLERKSEHPIGEAIVRYAEEKKLKLPEVEEFEAVYGRGIRGSVTTESGKREICLVGNRAFLAENGIEIHADTLQLIEKKAIEGNTPLLAAMGGELCGIVCVADEVKESSVKAVKELQNMGIRVVLLTGDNRNTAEAVRKQVGIDEAVAEVLPQQKEEKIRKLMEAGHKVCMIGDGVNDAPALTGASVGMAIGAGTDVAMESADIVLMRNSLEDAVTAIRLSKAVIRNIKQNLFWAFFYNAIGIPLAAGLWYPIFGVKLNPMFGAAAMSMSSIFVVGNALRLRRFAVTGQGTDKNEHENENTNENEKETKTMTKVMTIEGMMCAHCTGRVQKALEAVDGVSAVTMSLENKSATVELAKEVADDALTAAVAEAGYEVISIA